MLRNILLFLFSMLMASVTVAQDPTPYPTRVFTGRPLPKVWLNATNVIQSYPNPQTAYSGCNRKEKSYICDPNKQLPNSNEVDEIDMEITKLRSSTTGCESHKLCGNTTECDYSGVPFFIAVMESFEKLPTVQSVMMSYSQYFSKFWKLATCYDIVIVIASFGDKEIHIDVGEPIKKICSVDKQTKISEAVTKQLKEISGENKAQQFAQILKSIVTDYGHCFNELSEVDDTVNNSKSVLIIIIIVVVALVVVVIVAAIVFFVYKKCSRRPVNNEKARSQEVESLRKININT